MDGRTRLGMELEQNVGGTDRLVRTVLAVALTIVAVDALKNRRYSVVIGAGLGALGGCWGSIPRISGNGRLRQSGH